MTGRRFIIELQDAPGLARRHGGDVLPLADVPTFRRLAQVLKALGRVELREPARPAVTG